MYHDGVIRFEKYGLDLVLVYERVAKRNGGKVEAVYACKGVEECQVGTCVLDFERGIAEGIWPASPLRRIPVSAGGVTIATSDTRPRRKWWICWSTWSAGMAHCC